MKKICILLICLIPFLFYLNLLAQESIKKINESDGLLQLDKRQKISLFDSVSQVSGFTPYVSRLKAQVIDEKVILTWQESQEFSGTCLIYRSVYPFESTNMILNNEPIAEVLSGLETYTDIPSAGAYFYLVLLKNLKGEIYKIMVPLRNFLVKKIIVKGKPASNPEIIQISIIEQKEKIQLNWQSNNISENSELYIFRSLQMINSVEKLLKSIFIAKIAAKTGTYIDTPISGAVYYYCLIFPHEFYSRRVEFRRNRNYTAKGAVISRALTESLTKVTPGQVKSLPLINVDRDVLSGKELKSKDLLYIPRLVPYNQDSNNAIATLLLYHKPEFVQKNELEMKILPEDRNIDDIFDLDYKDALGFIKAKKYSEAEDLFRKILSKMPEEQLELKVHYYLGHCFYERDNNYEALLSLLFAEKKYSNYTQSHIDACLLRIYFQHDL